MKKIGFISDTLKLNIASDSLRYLCNTLGFSFKSISDYRSQELFPKAVWKLIQSSDVIVAYISKGYGNIYYEIGIAHGANKPVIIVAEPEVSIPPDLETQRIVQINSELETHETLAFRIKEAILESEQKSHLFYGPNIEVKDEYFPQRDISRSYIVRDFQSILKLSEAYDRSRKLEKWFASILRAIPGFDVVEAESTKNLRKIRFDLVIWNSRSDAELFALGNPIAVELKTTRNLDSKSITRISNLLNENHLKTGIIVLLGTINKNNKNIIKKHITQYGNFILVLEEKDLARIISPEDLLDLIKRKTRDLIYFGEL